MHGLIGQWTKLRAHGGDHPARQIEIATAGGFEVLLYRNHFLLAYKAVPAAQRLSVFRRVVIVGSHGLAHDTRGIFGDIKPGCKTVLQSHTGYVISVNVVPGLTHA